ncbi:hypothetical protein I3271_09305 [Photobacterium leiognathi]|uniref:hypothetical protein n=1 Tax=Photobacterium leiognathi TaxID=553611 RepID=UPI001EDFEE9A|nr:hypothetical protein [Photobacterium leiognathi]MCG3884885.1 hypothetical protein [Photobacterium leiognathi]
MTLIGHIFERYTKLGVAAFASGYAESLSNKSESKNSDGSKDVEISAIETAKDRAMYDGGKMISAFIPFFERGFDRPATVNIPSGSSIRIMFASGFDLNK